MVTELAKGFPVVLSPPECRQAKPQEQDPGKHRCDAACLENTPNTAAAAAMTLTGVDLALQYQEQRYGIPGCFPVPPPPPPVSLSPQHRDRNINRAGKMVLTTCMHL